MPKIVGLTGGIGSGKTRIVASFNALGVPCYIADEAAKRLMHTRKVKAKIQALFGSQAYTEEGLNRSYIAEIVFSNPEKLQQLNAIVHPAVGEDFATWLTRQNHPYDIKEVAILFETGGDKAVDQTLLITAPKTMRLERVKTRDKVSEEAVYARMANQWEDEQKRTLADHVLENIHWETTQKKIVELHQHFLSLASD